MESLQILWVNRSFTPKGTGVKPHDHPYYHMFAMLSGSLRFTVGNEELSLQKGDCLIVPRSTRHSYINDCEETVEALEVKFTVKSKSLTAEIDRLLLPMSNDPLVCPLIDKLVREYENGASGADDAAKSYLGAAIRLISQSERLEREKETAFFDFRECSELTKAVAAWLEEHYREPYSLDVLARELAFNKTYLCTAFKKDTDLTILDYLNLIRIRHAAELISYSEHSIALVAELCGFGSASTFNHVFQKYIGTSPLQVRKAYPNGILLENGSGHSSKTGYPKRYLYNVLAGKEIH